jgi:hypothetical protein
MVLLAVFHTHNPRSDAHFRSVNSTPWEVYNKGRKFCQSWVLIVDKLTYKDIRTGGSHDRI